MTEPKTIELKNPSAYTLAIHRNGQRYHLQSVKRVEGEFIALYSAVRLDAFLGWVKA